jgi:hypothetical protein
LPALADVGLTADPLERFKRTERIFGGRTIDFQGVTLAGRRWAQFYFRHLGNGGIAFSSPADHKAFMNLSDEARRAFSEELRVLVDQKDVELYQQRVRRDRLHLAMKSATRWAMQYRTAPACRMLPTPALRPASRERAVRRRRSGRGSAARRVPPSQDEGSPESPPSSTWAYLSVASRRMREHERRRDAKRAAA